jgi:transposase
MRPMPDLARPAIADLHAWREQQNPLVRALTEPLTERVVETLTAMQAVIDTEVAAREAQAAAVAAREAQAAERAMALESALGAEVAAREAQAAENAMVLQVTKDRIDQLERMMFGRKAERTPKTPDARKEARKRRQNELSEEQKEVRRKAAAAARQAKLDALRTKVLDLPVDAEVSEGRTLPPAGSVIYEWHPGELVRILVRREQRVLEDGTIVTAAPPPQVVDGGSYGPALYAKVVVDKCLDGMPLRRQERAFERIGAPLPVSVLCALFHRSAELIEPLYKAMVAHVGAAPHVSADETPQPVLDDEKVRKGWMWVFATDDAILYVYAASRGGTVADGVLGKSKGTLTVDGHTGYNVVTKEGRRERGGCWSHARRGLFEARTYAEVLVDGLLSQIGELFYVEQLAIEQQIVGTPAHLELRQERSAKVLARVLATAESHVDMFDARSSLAKALRYLLNQREPLSLFLKDPAVPIHNNLSERALRVVAMLRKAALFVGSDEGGRHLAMLLSMTATCQMHGVNPQQWMADVLIAVQDVTDVESLLPWNWKTGRGTSFRPAFDTA